MSTMTSVMRGAPSLTVAPTQNTAPVFEFRCLYTHDLRKKKKIWHDGSLRFHTFNRRVMVYDDSKNYIGDAHWRETGEFREGEELRLDKGIMVEVGEQIGHTETDLASIILEKRRPDTSSPPRPPLPSNTFSSICRSNATGSDIRPKSLAAVLGASQGPIGRARYSTRSPFEARQENVHRMPTTSTEHPAKKQRIGSEKENVVYSLDLVREVHRTAPPQASKSGMANPGAAERRKRSAVPVRRTGSPVSRPLPLQVSSCGTKEKARGLGLNAWDSGRTKPPSLIQISATGSERGPLEGSLLPDPVLSSRTEPKPLEAHTLVQEESTAQMKASAAGGICAHTPCPRLSSKLRFAASKPRNKLVCKSQQSPNDDGIAASGKDVRVAQCRTSRHNIATATKMSNLPIPPPDGEIVDSISEGEDNLSRAVATPARQQAARTPHNRAITINSSPPSTPSSSALFVRQATNDQSLYNTQEPPEGDFEPPLDRRSPIIDTPSCQVAKLPQSPNHISSIANSSMQDADTANKETEKKAQSFEELPNASPQDWPLLHAWVAPSPVQQDGAPMSPNQRHLRRVLSENDFHPSRSNAISPRVSPRGLATDTVGQAHEALHRGHKPFRSPSKVQRCISDPNHLAERVNVTTKDRAIVSEAVEASFEPWSEPEAYLLFEWWPVGKQKPCLVVP